MSLDKNLPALSIGTGLALKNVSKSLKITNKLLKESDDSKKSWKWWIELSNGWKDSFFPHPYDWGWDKHEVSEDYDWFEDIVKNYWLNYDLMNESVSELYGKTELSLLANSCSDLKPLTKLPNLKNLIISVYKGDDENNISQLKELRNLESLNLELCELKGFSSLYTLTSLKRLELNNNDIHDLSVICSFKKLKHLKILQQNLLNIEFLGSLDFLEVLDVGRSFGIFNYNSISDIKVLANLRMLQKLNLTGNCITNIDPLKNLSNLRELNLQNNPVSIKDIDKLQKSLPNCLIIYDNSFSI